MSTETVILEKPTAKKIGNLKPKKYVIMTDKPTVPFQMEEKITGSESGEIGYIKNILQPFLPSTI